MISYDTVFLKRKDWEDLFDMFLSEHEKQYGMIRIDVKIEKGPFGTIKYTPVYSTGKGTGSHSKFKKSLHNMYVKFFSLYKVKNPMDRKWK